MLLNVRRRAWALLLVALLASSPATGAAGSRIPSEALEAVDAVEMRKHVEFLASQELGGRYTLSPSIKIAARYLATRLESYGFRGVGKDGSFMQPFEVVSSTVDQ